MLDNLAHLTGILGSPTLPSNFRIWIRDHYEYSFSQYLQDNVKRSSKADSPPRGMFVNPRSNPEPDTTTNWKAEVMLFRLWSGHTNTADHWLHYKIKIADQKCKICHKEQESAKHILLECEKAWPNESPLRNLFNASDKTFGEFVRSGCKTIRKTLVRSIEALSKLGVVL